MSGEKDRGPGPNALSYRCPVCGHVDATSLDGAESAVVRCSHCDTHLEVRPKGDTSLAARVAPTNRRRSRERA